MAIVKMHIALAGFICLSAVGCSQKYSDRSCTELAQVKASEGAAAAAATASFQKTGDPADAKTMKTAQENVDNARFQQGQKKCTQ